MSQQDPWPQVQQATTAVQLVAQELLTAVVIGFGLVGVGRMVSRFVQEQRGPTPRPALLPETLPRLASIPELGTRLEAVSEELGSPSVVELVGWGRADRLARLTAKELEKEWGIGGAFQEADSLRTHPLATIGSWLQPGGAAHSSPLLQGVAQTVIEAAEARVEKGRQALPAEAIADINYRISLRTSYGLREETAEAAGTVIVWSNASADWHDDRSVRKGERLVLDANQVFVPYPRNRVAAVLHLLEPLPLGKYSFEAIARKTAEARKLGLEGRMESDERWLRGMQALGLEVYAGPGYEGRVPVPRVSDLPGLAHIGGGTLAGRGKVFRLRANPETGTRFYVAEAAYG